MSEGPYEEKVRGEYPPPLTGIRTGLGGHGLCRPNPFTISRASRHTAAGHAIAVAGGR